MGTRINFFFTEALRSLTTNVATSVAATLSMLVALLMVTVFLALFVAAKNYTEDIQNDAGVVRVFLAEGIEDPEISALTQEMQGMSEVEKVNYVSKEEALKIAKGRFKDTDIMDSLPGNPFPASLEMDLKNPDDVEVVAARFEKAPHVSKVNYGGEQVVQLIDRIDSFKFGLAILSVLLVVSATMLVSNTIRISVFARRREIEVMKLVGASNSFVRLPFMIEGFLCGLAGAVGAIVLARLAWLALESALPEMTGGAGQYVNALSIFGAVIAMGLVLGGLGSGMTIRKYLRV